MTRRDKLQCRASLVANGVQRTSTGGGHLKRATLLTQNGRWVAAYAAGCWPFSPPARHKVLGFRNCWAFSGRVLGAPATNAK
jgi:hypothetical protein